MLRPIFGNGAFCLAHLASMLVVLGIQSTSVAVKAPVSLCLFAQVGTLFGTDSHSGPGNADKCDCSRNLCYAGENLPLATRLLHVKKKSFTHSKLFYWRLFFAMSNPSCSFAAVSSPCLVRAKLNAFPPPEKCCYRHFNLFGFYFLKLYPLSPPHFFRTSLLEQRERREKDF